MINLGVVAKALYIYPRSSGWTSKMQSTHCLRCSYASAAAASWSSNVATIQRSTSLASKINPAGSPAA